MPAARQRSRSPCIACAVSATIGSAAAPSLLAVADRPASPRSRPSRASAGPSARRRTARRRRVDRLDRFAAVLDGLDGVPALLQQRRHQLAVDGVVFGDEDAERTQRRDAGALDSRLACARAAAATPKSRASASSRSECLTGLVRNASMPMRWRRATSSARPTDVSITIGVFASRRSRLIAAPA